MAEDVTVDGDGISRRKLLRNAAAAGVGAAVWASPSAASLVGTPAYAANCSPPTNVDDVEDLEGPWADGITKTSISGFQVRFEIDGSGHEWIYVTVPPPFTVCNWRNSAFSVDELTVEVQSTGVVGEYRGYITSHFAGPGCSVTVPVLDPVNGSDMSVLVANCDGDQLSGELILEPLSCCP